MRKEGKKKKKKKTKEKKKKKKKKKKTKEKKKKMKIYPNFYHKKTFKGTIYGVIREIIVERTSGSAFFTL